MTDILI